MDENKEVQGKEAWKDKGRMAIYSLAGVYLLYLAYEMFRAISSSAGSEKVIMIVFSVLFAVIGAGAILWSGWNAYKMFKKGKSPNEKANK